MTAGAAKKQPDDHPAKVAYNKMGDAGDADSEKKEKPEVNIFDKPEDDDKPKAKATEKPGGASHIESSGGNNVLLAKGTADHIARHNKPGEGSVFSDDVSMDDIQNAISKIPEEFYENGGGIHTTTVPNAGYNLVQKSSDIEKDHPNAKKIMVKKRVGYDREKNEPIMKEVPAYIIDGDKEDFKTDQLNVVVRPSNPDFMSDELKNNSDVKNDLEGGKSHSVLSSFPGDPDVPPAQDWEDSGHAIIIPNGGKDADKTNWVDEPEGDSSSEHAAKVQSVSDIDDIVNLGSDSDFDQKFDDIKDQGSGYKDEYGKEMDIDDLHYKVKMLNSGEDPEDFLGDFEDEDELVDAWKDSVGKAMAGKQGRTGTEEIKVINGKKYRAITESKKSKKHYLKENYERFFGIIKNKNAF
jgi:hypothetical protein